MSTKASGEEASMGSKASESLKMLTSLFEELRSTMQCRICTRMLYEPYTLTCGHTYCYTCLCQWFTGNSAKKTCPDCRVIISAAPAPSYLLRDITNRFISNEQLLSNGETVAQHQTWRQEEADALEKDRALPIHAGGGLFKGEFAPRPPRKLLRLPIRDDEDGVTRCPSCTWELEDGEPCAHCGYDPDTMGDSDDELSEDQNLDSELDAELDMDDEDDDLDHDSSYDYRDGEANFHSEEEMDRELPAQRVGRTILETFRRALHSAASEDSNEPLTDHEIDEWGAREEDYHGEYDEEEENEEDSSMREFVVPDDEEDVGDDEDQEESSMQEPHDESDASEEPSSEVVEVPPPVAAAPARTRFGRRLARVVPSDSESDDEPDELPISRGPRRRRAVA